MLIGLQRCGPLGRIVLDRPAKRNALTTAMLTELRAVLDEVAADPQLRVVTVCGAGPVFCAGADTAEFAHAGPEVMRSSWTPLGQQVFGALAQLPQTTLAVLTGGAFGGGLELALHCDLRIATAEAVLALPEATLGTAPGWAGLGRAVEIAGLGAARMLALTGRRMSAADALRLGLVDAVVPGSEAMAVAVDAFVRDILATDPVAQAILKRTLINRRPTAALVDSLAGAYLTSTGRTT